LCFNNALSHNNRPLQKWQDYPLHLPSTTFATDKWPGQAIIVQNRRPLCFFAQDCGAGAVTGVQKSRAAAAQTHDALRGWQPLCSESDIAVPFLLTRWGDVP